MVGLGLLAGAVLHGTARAQVRDTTKKRDTTITVPVGQRPDSVLRDSLARLDSIEQARIRADTIKAPITRAELPMQFGIGRRFYWSRDSLFATGAITLADLLERVTGVTVYQAGWISAPAVASYMGDIRRIRVFYDGFEQLALDPRSHGVLDLTQINLWSVEDAVIEPTADEIRVYLRSWRVRNTVPETRTDVSTGDQATNLYRAFFGKRFHDGADLQFGAQQYGTTPPSILGSSSDQTGIIVRAGWANSVWSVDAYASRIGRHRGTILGQTLDFIPSDSIATLASSRTDAYLRVGFGDPDVSHVWAQAMLVGSKYDYSGVRTLPLIANPATRPESLFKALPLDTNVYRSQYIITGGTTRGPLRLSAAERLFAGAGQTMSAPEVRASYAVGRLGVSAYAEGDGIDSASHLDVTGQFSPLSFVSLLASVGRVSDRHQISLTLPNLVGAPTPENPAFNFPFTSRYARGELGVRVRNLWLVGGVIRRDSISLAPPTVFDTTFIPVADRAATGITAGIRGQLWKLLHADLSAVRWNDSTGFYRPRYETRSELFFGTNLLQRFPSGDFGIKGSIVHEYRSGVRFPTMGAAIDTAPGFRTISTLLEIRVLSATISWQFRNILGERYMQVPNFIMPRQTNFYGVRWTFFN